MSTLGLTNFGSLSAPIQPLSDFDNILGEKNSGTKGAGLIGYTPGSGYGAGSVGLALDGAASSAALTAYEADVASSANGSGVDLVGGSGRVISTITALRALLKTGVGKAFVLGYYASGDGGGGEYYYDSSDTTSADNGGTIIVASDGGRWKLAATDEISVRQFGVNPSQTDTVNATRFVACATACVGFTLRVPAGVYNIGAINLGKTLRVHIEGEFNSYDATYGSVLNYTGSTTMFLVGVNDGNPDSTGFIRNVTFRYLTLTTTTGLTAVNFTNAALCRIDYCSIAGFKGKQIFLHETVGIDIENSDVRGDGGTASGNYGVYLDNVQYFGNFATRIANNHIYQTNWLVRIAGGRNLTIQNNIFENVMGWTVANPQNGGMFVFETAGYISNLVIDNNYCEAQRGWCLYSNPSSPFTGAILNLIVTNNEWGGSGDAANPNPGVGNLPRGKVITQRIEGNLFTDAQMNAAASLGLSAGQYFPSTTLFDPTTTVIPDSNSNIGYEDSIVYALRTTELLGTAGDFAAIASTTAGTLPIFIANGVPAGWTSDISGAALNLVVDGIQDTFVVQTPGSGTTNVLFHKTLTITSDPNVTFYALAFTARGRVIVNAQAVQIYDNGSSVAGYTTQVVTFQVAASTTSLTIQFATAVSNTFTIAEARLWKIGGAEYNVPGPGTMNQAITRACKRLMKRGAY